MTHVLAAADPMAPFMDALWTKAIVFVILAGIVGLVIRALLDGFESFVARKARERRSRGNTGRDTALSAATDATERTSESAPHCPTCNRVMVLREARRGPNRGSKFWGCPAYPDCRGTRPIATHEST
jgi:hypothetical protein